MALFFHPHPQLLTTEKQGQVSSKIVWLGVGWSLVFLFFLCGVFSVNLPGRPLAPSSSKKWPCSKTLKKSRKLCILKNDLNVFLVPAKKFEFLEPSSSRTLLRHFFRFLCVKIKCVAFSKSYFLSVYEFKFPVFD